MAVPEPDNVQGCPESFFEFRVCCRALVLHHVNQTGSELHDVQVCPEMNYGFRSWC